MPAMGTHVCEASFAYIFTTEVIYKRICVYIQINEYIYIYIYIYTHV